MPISKIPNSITVGDVSADVSVNYSSEQRSETVKSTESSQDTLQQLKLLNARIEEAFDTHIDLGDIEHED